MHVPTIKHLLPQSIIQQHLLIALLDQVEPADGHDDLLRSVVDVDDVGWSAALGTLTGDTLNDAVGVHPIAAGRGVLGVVEILLADDEDDAVDARDGLELFCGGEGPGDAVVGVDEGAAIPHPAGATHAQYAFRLRSLKSMGCEMGW